MILGMPSADIGERDPHWASVVSLLSFDEADGATSIVDARGRSWTSEGGHTVSHAQSRFGPGSLSRSGAFPSRFRCMDSAIGIGTASFTAECWVRLDAANNRAVMTLGSWLLYLADPWTWALFDGSNRFFGNANVGLNTWAHVALVRDGAIVRLYINGTPFPTSYSLPVSLAADIYLGDFNAGNLSAAFVDEFRLTIGVARYTAAFTPRASAFPRR